MKIFYILLFLVLTIFQGHAQSKPVFTGSEAVKEIVRLYPNPATTLINFDFQNDDYKQYNIQIYSFVGKKVFESTQPTSKTIVNLTDFYRGIYIFQIRDKSGRVVDSGKFQVSK